MCYGWPWAIGSCCTTGDGGFAFGGAAFIGPQNSSSLVNVVQSAEALGASATATATVTGSATCAAASASHGNVKSSVAIGVGVALGVALLIAVAAIVWLALKFKQRPSTPAGPAYYAQDYKPVEAGSPARPYEVQHTPRFEAQGDNVPELHPIAKNDGRDMR